MKASWEMEAPMPFKGPDWWRPCKARKSTGWPVVLPTLWLGPPTNQWPPVNYQPLYVFYLKLRFILHFFNVCYFIVGSPGIRFITGHVTHSATKSAGFIAPFLRYLLSRHRYVSFGLLSKSFIHHQLS